MNREILFRGKRIDNGEWVEGFYVVLPMIHYKRKEPLITHAETGTSYEVDPATIGQYVGMTDKNGKRIFEGDVVAQLWYDFDEPADDSFGEVVFSVADCSFSVLDLNKNEIMSMGHGCAYHYEVEVIGNIHDNPELIGGGDHG